MRHQAFFDTKNQSLIEDIEKKICKQCGLEKPISEFYCTDPFRAKKKYKARCKECLKK